jgi:hypothetical protein
MPTDKHRIAAYLPSEIDESIISKLNPPKPFITLLFPKTLATRAAEPPKHRSTKNAKPAEILN